MFSSQKKGKIVQFNGKTYYQKPEYRVSIPFDQKRYDLKEYRFQKKFIASLILKDSPENSIFLSARKNIDNISAEQDLKETLEKVKKEEVFNLNVKEIPLANKIVARRLLFEFKEGGSLLYLICVGEFIYRLGLELDDGRGEFDELSSELDLLVGGVLIGEG